MNSTTVTSMLSKQLPHIKKPLSHKAQDCLLYTLKDEYFSKIKPTTYKVFVAMMQFVNDIGEAWPSQKTLMDLSGVSKNTIRVAIEELMAIGWIDYKWFAGNRNRGMKYKVLIEGQNLVDPPPNPDEWRLSEIPDGFYGFSKPSPANINFYSKQEIYLPDIELIGMLLKEQANNQYAMLYEVINKNKGLPTRLFGFLLALYLGDPWNFLWYAKNVFLKWDYYVDDYVLEMALDEIKNKYPVNITESGRVRNKSKMFKDLYKCIRKKLKTEIHKRQKLNYCYKHDDVLPKIVPDLPDRDSDLYKYNNELWNIRRFRLEELDIYILSPEWLEKHKNMILTYEEHNQLYKIVWFTLIPLLIEISRVVRFNS